jgi:general secretion pathway protein I
MRPTAEGGFTLIELLVALAVFSLAALALLNVTGENVRTAGNLEARVLAGVVADNRAVEALTALQPPPLGVGAGREAAGGRLWRWTRRVTPTADSELIRIDITVAAAERPETLAEVTLFRSRR